MSAYEQTIIGLYGDEGKQWLASLPNLIKKVSLAWELDSLKVMKNLSYNYVLSGFQHKKPIILKLIFDKSALQDEVRALKAFAGYGVIAVLAQMDNALLLEQAVTGLSIKNDWPKNEEEAIEIVCDCARRLHQAPIPKRGEFPHLRDWFSILHKDWSIPKVYLEKARELSNILLQPVNEDKLLHGDLHHENILRHGDEWLVIDPKGVMGDEAYELAAFLQNPMPELLKIEALPVFLSRRISLSATLLNLDKKRIYQWCFAQAILSWVWNLEDGLDPHYFARLADIFFSLLDKN
ncbi:aminoglycoside phosphotransferase family protein [Legionella brunensis]|uniref:Aminoglycoside/hydroxyurea antibiotic resistance kinase n=1 Tax=Legionella brunensis TaxID=29422 RepID=A0A0W0SL28_9GAMM|nr:aminoglycoside phosphotransferase family protein [Legionella brunensis]KTC84030.1 Aminoglycoside/hydroxyurea antibiotic resistance kinase [Legionella brunensis]